MLRDLFDGVPGVGTPGFERKHAFGISLPARITAQDGPPCLLAGARAVARVGRPVPYMVESIRHLRGYDELGLGHQALVGGLTGPNWIMRSAARHPRKPRQMRP